MTVNTLKRIEEKHQGHHGCMSNSYAEWDAAGCLPCDVVKLARALDLAAERLRLLAGRKDLSRATAHQFADGAERTLEEVAR